MAWIRFSAEARDFLHPTTSRLGMQLGWGERKWIQDYEAKRVAKRPFGKPRRRHLDQYYCFM
jgi:hypothetical protein